MNQCTSGACRQGRAPCPHPAACHLPEPEPPRRYSPGLITQNAVICALCMAGFFFIFFCLGYLVQAVYAP